MDENKLNGQSPKEDRLVDPEQAEEIIPAEEAMASAGLSHPNQTEPAAPEEETPTFVPTEEFRDEEYRETFGEGDELERLISGDYDALVQPEQTPEENTPAEEPKAEAEPLQVRKGRPKRKKGYGLFGIPHILVTVVWIAIVVAIGVSLGRMAWVCVADVLAFGREEETVTVTIKDEDTLDDIANKLEHAGLIKYPELFKLYATLTDGRGKISSGVFTL